MALYNIARSLLPNLSKLDIAWSGHLFDLSQHCVDPESVCAEDYDAMVYVCGPLTEWHAALFSRFSKIKRIAVGVSVTSNIDPLSLVDAIHVRDSEIGSSFDLALAEIGYPHLIAPAKFREDRISTCLVGPQDEYGALDGHIKAKMLIESATYGIETISVQTLLDVSRPTPASVELDLQCSSVLVTTRMHASLLAIYHGVPLVAIDQIKGAAKVTRMLSKIDYPVFNAWTARPDQIKNEIFLLSKNPPSRALVQAKMKLVEHSRFALTEATAFILDEVGVGRVKEK
jgi:hypothetical protein